MTDLRNAKPRRESVSTLPAILPREMPRSEAAEQGVLGCLLLDPQMCIPMVVERCAGKEIYYDLRNQSIQDVMLEMFERGASVEMLTIRQRLMDKGLLESVGGFEYLVSLQNAVPSASSLEHYLEIVLEKYQRRQLIQLCTGIVSKAYESEIETKEMFEDFQKSAMELGMESRGAEDIGMAELMPIVQERIMDYAREKSGAKGLSTGFYDLDRVFNGLKPGQLIVIGARPGIGKSSLAMNIAENIAMAITSCAVGFFSMEMEAVELGERLLASQGPIDGSDIQNGELTDEGYAKATRAIRRLQMANIRICDKGGMTWPIFRARYRRMVQRHKIRVGIIDYLQLFHLPSKDNRANELGIITNGLKALAKETKTTIILLSQLNRDLEKENRRPRASDLRDTGSIEQDADKILLLSEELEAPPKPKSATKKKKTAAQALFDKENKSPEPEPQPEREQDPNVQIIIGEIPKNRGGKRATGNRAIRFTFRKNFTRYEDEQKIDAGDSANWA